MNEYPQLPADFEFGTSTAAYQIEGAVTEDGRGPSIWDTFCATPGRIANGDTGETACDHYHRYAQDVELMAGLGFNAYRFSFSWPRVQPDGSGALNPAGLGFYDRLLDALVSAGIKPMATAFHWDLPQALQDDGGWQSRQTALRFADYVAVLGERFADRVVHWCPVNEPNIHTLLGHGLGVHAPGLQLGLGVLGVAHHVLLGHGLAVDALRSAGAGSIGSAPNHQPIWPASGSDEDRDAVEWFDDLYNWCYADPVLKGEYPQRFAEYVPGVQDGDLDLISAPLDFYGVNYYCPHSVSSAHAGSPLPVELGQVPGYPTTDFAWPIVPTAFTQMLIDLKTRYGKALPPLRITESGCSYGVGLNEEAVVDDQARIDYHHAHLSSVLDAMSAGVQIAGYYAWSLLDNFEWAEGYRQRFGLVWVDYATQQRIPKKSAQWFSEMIAAQGPAQAS